MAEKLDVSEQTVCAWVQRPAFQAAVNREREAMLEATRDHMRSLGLKATQTLEEVLETAEKPADKLKAVELVLKHIGFTDPQSGLWGWGVGPTTPEEIAEKEREGKIMGGLYKDLMEGLGA